jgi:hypothetical protein
MKKVIILLTLFIAIKTNAQELSTFFTPNSNSLIIDFCQHDGNTYLLINNEKDSIIRGTGEVITSGNFKSTLIKKGDGEDDVILGLEVGSGAIVESRVFVDNDKLFLSVSTNSDLVLNDDTFYVEGNFNNFFLFNVTESPVLVEQLFHTEYDVMPHVFVDIEQVSFLFFMKSKMMYSAFNDSLTLNTKGKYEGYSVTAKWENSGFSVLNEESYFFYDTEEINYYPFTFKTQQGSAPLVSVLCLGLQLFKDGELIAETDSFDSKKHVFLLADNSNQTNMSPLVLAHDRGYSAKLEAFYQKGDKWFFYFNPVFVKEFCFGEQCLQNNQITDPLRVQLTEYSWETGDGLLDKYPDNFNFSMRSCKIINDELYILGEYSGDAGFINSKDIYFGKESKSSYFLAKYSGSSISWPIIIRGIDVPLSFVDFYTENQFKYYDNAFCISGDYSAGMVLGKDSVTAKTGNDMFFATVSKDIVSVNYSSSENNFGIYPNPTSNQLTIATDVTLQNAQFVVYSTSGQQVLNGSTNGTINVSSLNSGMYLLQIEQAGAKVKKLFVVE